MAKGVESGGGLIDLILRMSQARGLDDVTSVIRSELRALLGCDGVTFVLRDGDCCHYVDEDAIGPLWKGQRFPMEICISGWAMLHRQPAIVPDITLDTRIPQDAYRPTFVRSLVMVPVQQDEPVAAIGAYWARPHLPDPTELTLLEVVANSAAVAMTNIALLRSLREASEQKSRFLAACSHDLRQPFQAMRLYHSVLGHLVGSGAREIVTRLGEAMAHGEDLLAALLDLSTIESGLITANPTVVRLDEVFGRIEATFAAQAEDKGLRLAIVPCSAPVVTDPTLLARILGNLLANAIKFTDAGGRVLMGTRRRGGGIAVEVRDSGSGIPPEQQARIFEDFYQVANAARDRRQGIGLGLGIARRLADTLGHRLTVASTPGKGSAFAVTVPLAP